MKEDDYEIVPLDPLRKMERRVHRLEKSGTTSETIHELIEIVRANQHVIDEMVRINSEMINRVSELTVVVTKTTEKMNDFIDKIQVVDNEEEPDEKNYEIEERLKKIERKINSFILSNMKFKQRDVVQQNQQIPQQQQSKPVDTWRYQ